MADLSTLHQYFFSHTELNNILQGFSQISKSDALEMVMSAFKAVNRNKYIGKTQVSFAFENAKTLIEGLNLSEQEQKAALLALESEMTHSSVIHKSQKGFIAIDIDGTALVQKIDKHFIYGLTHSQSHVRQTLIEYMGLAQAAGYDIVVLTARSELVESHLKASHGRLGTKHTDDIVEILDQYGIKINDIARAPVGLKGAKMQEILAAYQRHGSGDAIGILFDDQLKQINDVAAKKDSKLFAYDINSPHDLLDYIERVAPEFDKTSPLYPEEIIRRVQANNPIFIQLNTAVSNTNFVNHPNDEDMIQTITRELAIRLYEAVYRHYVPEVNWVTNAVAGVQRLIEKMPAIMTIDIQNASTKIFGQSCLDHVNVNSRCEAELLNLLQYMNRIPIKNEIEKNTKKYWEHLKAARAKYADDEDVPQQLKNKLGIVNQLCAALQNENPTIALEDFTAQFIANKKTLQQSRNDTAWYSSIKALLAKISGIGYFFQTEGERFANWFDSNNKAKFFVKRPNELSDEDQSLGHDLNKK